MVRRADLPPDQQALLDEQEARVVWEPFVQFVGQDDPRNPDPLKAHRPLDVGPSLVDRERRGHLVLEWARSWSGAIRLEVSDGDTTTDLMLDAVQVSHLRHALERWEAGTLDNWHASLRGD
jgi:hypothetical protein